MYNSREHFDWIQSSCLSLKISQGQTRAVVSRPWSWSRDRLKTGKLWSRSWSWSRTLWSWSRSRDLWSRSWSWSWSWQSGLVHSPDADFSKLHQLFEKILCVPSTSAPVERVFSHGGLFMRPHRASLGDKTLRALVFLQCNKHLKWLSDWSFNN